MTNINEMFQAAEGAKDDTDFPDLLTPAQIPENTTLLCEISYSKPGTTKKGGKSFQQKLKVAEPGHEFEGGEVFDTLNFSAGDTDGNMSSGQLGYNKRLFAKLGGAGLDGQYFSASPSDEAISIALKGTKVLVKFRWQKPNDKGDVYLDNTTTWSPVGDGGGGGYVPGQQERNPKGF
jgi:hypothetical protein